MKARLVLNLVCVCWPWNFCLCLPNCEIIMCTTTPSKVLNLEDLFLESLSKSKVMQTTSHSSVLVFSPKHCGESKGGGASSCSWKRVFHLCELVFSRRNCLAVDSGCPLLVAVPLPGLQVPGVIFQCTGLKLLNGRTER